MEDAAGGYTYIQAMAAGRARRSGSLVRGAHPRPAAGSAPSGSRSAGYPDPGHGDPALHELAGAAAARGRDIVARRRPIEGRHHRDRKACIAAAWLRPRGPRNGRPFLSDVANLHVALSVENGRFVEAYHPVYEQGVKGVPWPSTRTAAGCCPTRPGLGVELDWDWIDDHTQEIIRSGETPS